MREKESSYKWTVYIYLGNNKFLKFLNCKGKKCNRVYMGIWIGSVRLE